MVARPRALKLAIRQSACLLKTTRVASTSLDYRQRGLLSYSSYVVDFVGNYPFRNPASEPQLVTFQLTLSAEKPYYGLVMELSGRPVPLVTGKTRRLRFGTRRPRRLRHSPRRLLLARPGKLAVQAWRRDRAVA
jgi:hypothetical protein